MSRWPSLLIRTMDCQQRVTERVILFLHLIDHHSTDITEDCLICLQLRDRRERGSAEAINVEVVGTDLVLQHTNPGSAMTLFSAPSLDSRVEPLEEIRARPRFEGASAMAFSDECVPKGPCILRNTAQNMWQPPLEGFLP